MNIKYLKNPKTKDRFYPITKSTCIIDAFSINDLEIDRIFNNNLSVPKQQKGMSYLNLQGLIHYHSKIEKRFNSLPEVQIYTAGENIVIENNVVSAIIPEVNLDGYATEQWVKEQNYLTEHQDISNKVDIEDFQEATHVTSAALNLFHQINSWQNEE